MIAVSALLAQYINLPGIVGTFLAGLAVNAAVKDKPAKNKLEFMGNTLFIPIFFIVTGFLINPLALLRSLTHDSILAGGIIAALVAATLAATLVAYRDLQCRRPAVARQPHAQRGPHHGAGYIRPRPGADATLRIAHVGTGAASPGSSHEFQLTGVCNSCEGARPVGRSDAERGIDELTGPFVQWLRSAFGVMLMPDTKAADADATPGESEGIHVT